MPEEKRVDENRGIGLIMIGKILTDYRYTNRMSMRELAKQLGVSVATVCRIEKGLPMEQVTILKLINVMFGTAKIGTEKREKV
jgi:transcriptional regulator with XRE-family HTH domain